MRQQTPLYETFVSGFIVLAFLAQLFAIAATPLKTGLGGKKLWPFLSYHMYSEVRHENQTVEVYDLLEGVRKDGSTTVINKEDLGLNLWDWRFLMSGLTQEKDASIHVFLNRYKYPNDLTEIRVLSYPVKVTREGPVEIPSQVLARIPLADVETD